MQWVFFLMNLVQCIAYFVSPGEIVDQHGLYGKGGNRMRLYAQFNSGNSLVTLLNVG